jgi:Transport and Golgi organisation 2
MKTGRCHACRVCTVVVSLAPGERVPLRLLGIRDELTNRPWRPPAPHWPGSHLIGGIDEQGGGTWLAVHPDIPRVACLLNGRGQAADPARRRSRGDLPLRAAAEGPGFLDRLADDPDALAAYDPFHLICATLDSVSVLTWEGAYRSGDPVPSADSVPSADPMPSAGTAGPDGPELPGHQAAPAVRPVVRDLAPGTHLFTNAGHAYPAGPGDPAGEPKAAHFADKFAAARPSADPALPIAQAWGDWLTLASGDGLDPADPAAIIVRRDLEDGRVYGTTSVTLVALANPGGRPPGALLGADAAVRYDFQPHPGSSEGWYSVSVG